MALWSRVAVGLSLAAQASAATTCPGTTTVSGWPDAVTLVNAKWDTPGVPAGTVSVSNGMVSPGIFGRTYFSDACVNSTYNPHQYIAMPMLGKKFSWTVDLSEAGCGCNAALYLTSLHQSTSSLGGCEDYYCDANSVCGLACAEIDLQEANKYAWHSTLHVSDDGSGSGIGYGGGGGEWNNNRDWTSVEYGPQGKCIDTTKPFQVAVSFPIGPDGHLEGMDLLLSQPGQECTLERKHREYQFHGRNGISELSQALANGMTPIISYWKADDMTWMDGRGKDQKGPCDKDDSYAQCGPSVHFSDFKLSDIQGQRRLRQKPPAQFV